MNKLMDLIFKLYKFIYKIPSRYEIAYKVHHLHTRNPVFIAGSAYATGKTILEISEAMCITRERVRTYLFNISRLDKQD